MYYLLYIYFIFLNLCIVLLFQELKLFCFIICPFIQVDSIVLLFFNQEWICVL